MAGFGWHGYYRPLPGPSVATGPGVFVLVVLIVVELVVLGVIVVIGGVAGIVAVSAALCRQLRTQPVKVRAAAVVLELASNLNLLGLGSAAPHWLDPLERPEPVRPHDACVADVPVASPRHDTQRTAVDPPRGTRRAPAFRTGTTVPGLGACGLRRSAA